MNSDTSKVRDSPRNDKSLLDILGELSKTPMFKEYENKGQTQGLAASSSNNLNVKNHGNIHPQDPRIRLQSNHDISPELETLAWGQTISETNSLKPPLKSGNQLKKEGQGQDELTKMMQIMEGASLSKCNPQLHESACQHELTTVKEEILDESDKLQSFTLLEQREEYMKKAAALQSKIEKLRQRRQELRGEGLRSSSPETLLQLKENTKHELVHQNKLKNIKSLIKMLNGIIGEKAQVTPNTNTDSTGEIKVSPPKRFNYVFYDPELHWCRVCDVFPATATEYLTHLHSQDHRDNMAAAHLEAPWHSVVRDDSFPAHPLADTKRMPVKGLQFFVPSTAWYCKLCDHFIGDLHCASAHLKSVTHSKNYSIFVKENPHWESDWMLDRQKAFEDKRLAVSLEEVDSFNIQSISGKENTQRNEKKPQKYLSSPITSSDSDMESSRREKVSGKRGESIDRMTDTSVSKRTSLERLEPLSTDRKLLNNINSTRESTARSPHAYRDKWQDRRSAARHDDGQSARRDRQYRHPSRHNDSYLRHDEAVNSLRYDRSPRARDSRSFERSRRRSERERSEPRSERSAPRSERSEPRFELRSERSELRSERSEPRSERARPRRDSPVSIRLSPESGVYDRRGKAGTVNPSKITSPNKEETRVLDEEKSRKRKEEMDAEIQKKVDEFKVQLIQIQEESQRTRISPKPPPTYSASAINHAPAVLANPAPTVHPAFTVPSTPAQSDDLDMNQVVEMATQILQQQAMLGAPFGVDPMCMRPPMPPPMPTMGPPLGGMGSILGPPPGMPMGMPQPLMQMPFMPPFMGGRLPLPPRIPIMKRKGKSNDSPSSSNKNVKQNINSNTICPPGEET